MQYNELGKTGLKVPALCLGTMTFGWVTEEGAAYSILDRALDAGLVFLDTADIYSRFTQHGTSETIIGRWIAGRDRSRVILATKVRGRMWEGPDGEGLSGGHIMRAVDDSLRRLQTDYIDLYQAHWPDDETPLEETLRAFDDLVRSGKVRFIGCSNFPAWLVMKSLWISDVNGLVRFESVQPHYNLLHRSEFEHELQPMCRNQQIGVIPYSPLAGGVLSGKYRRDAALPPGSRGESSERIKRVLAAERTFAILDRVEAVAAARGKTVSQVALAWLMAQPGVTAPIIGVRTPDHLEESLGAVGLELSEDEIAALTEASGAR